MAEPFNQGIPPPPGPASVPAGLPAWLIPVMSFAIGALLVGVIALLIAGDDAGIAEGSAGYEVLYEPPGDEGPDAFMSIADRVDLTGTSTTTSASAPLPDEVGLYGGSLEQTCDPELLIAYLESEPEKAAAWAGVQGINVDLIPEFIRSLIPAILQVDTRVTNHGFSDGAATPRQSILPAGTAVLVDDSGQPRVRCYCGNPLREPRDPERPCDCTTTTLPVTTTTTIVERTTTTKSLGTTTLGETGTTSLISLDDFYVSERGIEGPVPLLVGMNPGDATATGLFGWTGFDFTVATDGYDCGFGAGEGVLTDQYFTLVMTEGIVRFDVAPALRTMDGLGDGSSVVELTAALGTPDEVEPAPFEQGVQEHFYRFGDNGIAFSVASRIVVGMRVGDWVAIHLIEGCL